MTSSENSSEPTVPEQKPLLSFLAIITVIIGAFYISRKYIGTIPALIAAYLLYVYRDEIKKEFTEVVNETREVVHDRPN
jgi:hypothetical protein